MSFKNACWAWCLAALLLTGCATASLESVSTKAPDTWQGRLSVRVQSDPPSAVSANFSLHGHAQAGELRLYSPLGTTVAALQWTPKVVQLQEGGSTQSFNSLAELTRRTMGVTLPVSAMFEWLHGHPAEAEGWQADLSALHAGVLNAQRTVPSPEVQLRIRLDH